MDRIYDYVMICLWRHACHCSIALCGQCFTSYSERVTNDSSKLFVLLYCFCTFNIETTISMSTEASTVERSPRDNKIFLSFIMCHCKHVMLLVIGCWWYRSANWLNLYWGSNAYSDWFVHKHGLRSCYQWLM